MQKVYFLQLMRVYVCLIFDKVSVIYLVQVSLPLIGQQGMGDFFRYQPLLPIGWRTVKILCQRRRKMTNTAPTIFRAIKAASQSTFINAQIYSTCDLREGQK
jgi:hypothetical protein